MIVKGRYKDVWIRLNYERKDEKYENAYPDHFLF